MEENDKLILVTGSEGLLGSRFVELYPQKNKVHAPKHIDFDIGKASEIEAIFKSFDFKAVVHFAAKVDVVEGEKERDNKSGDFWQTNVEATNKLASAASKMPGMQFVYVSTDMVFPGTVSDPGPYPENHPISGDLSKLTWYGYTKGQGEVQVKKFFGDRAAIVRLATPALVESGKNLDFLGSIIKNYDNNSLNPLIENIKRSLSSVDDACKTIEIIINKKLTGVYHVSSTNTGSPYDIGSYLLGLARGVKKPLSKTTLEEHLVATGKPSYMIPKFGGLQSINSEQKLNLNFGTWKQVVDKLVSEGLAGKNNSSK